jgi:hypothetical protein
MEEREYFRLNNPFIIGSGRSFSNMLEQGNFNMVVLKANQSNAKVNERFLLTEPLAFKYSEKYANWLNIKAQSMGNTQGFAELKDTMSMRIKKWNHAITGFYEEGTSTYNKLMPNGRSELYRGSQEQIKVKIAAFRKELINYPDLQVVYNEVNDFEVILNSTHETKQISQDTIDIASKELEQAYQALGEMLFSNLLNLTDIFIKDTSVVKDYFIFRLLRSPKKQNDAEQGYILAIPELSKKAADISFSPDDTLLINNNGEKPIYCYSATTADAPEPTTLLEIAAGDQLEITAIDLGAPANKFLIFVNKETTPAEVEIVLV